jgi:ketosteroid isomerase-like protein
MPSNLELVARLFDVFPQGGVAPGDQPMLKEFETVLAELAAPDLEAAWIAPDPAFREEHTGAAGLLQGWMNWLAPFDRFRLEQERSLEAGDAVVTMVRMHAVLPGGENELETKGAAVLWWRDLKLTRAEFYLDRDQALRAAGLEP